MCQRKGVLRYCMLLCIVPFSNSDQSFKRDDEQSGNLTVHYDLHMNFEKDHIDKDELTQYNSRKNFTESNEDIRRESRVNFTKDERNNDDSMRYGFHTYNLMNDEKNNRTESDYMITGSTKANDENNSTSQWIYGNFTEIEGNVDYTMGDNKTLRNETCKDDKCIQLCCPRNDSLIQGKCVPKTSDFPAFPEVHGLNDSSRGTNLNEIIQLIVKHPCPNAALITLDRNEYAFQSNGSLYLLPYDIYYSAELYCLAIVNRDIYDVIACKPEFPIFITIAVIISLPFLLATFVVYTVLPELQNMHGYTLRAHVISLFISYFILPVHQQFTFFELGYPLCVTLAYTLTIVFTSSFLWLNVICFDIWWAFRDIRPVQGNVMQQERDKFIFYSIYAWGFPLLLGIICAIMDYTPNIPNYLIRPDICKSRIWFGSLEALSAYFYIPVGVTIICNICLFLITAVQITLKKKSTADDLCNSESKRHNDNKQRFMMYLKLCIIMGITWIMEVASYLVDQTTPSVVWFPTDMINSLQGLTIFIIFVCRKKIKRLLYKKYGWQCCAERRKSTTTFVSRSSTTTTSISISSGSVKLEDINPHIKTQ